MFICFILEKNSTLASWKEILKVLIVPEKSHKPFERL